ncbi:MAG TPA: hypothetical protein VKT82_26970 [Ktedonobacterales bacterium]|nr:hypothetical protein [Ktedonobacterales bacterium]
MFGHHETAQAKVLLAEMVIKAWEEEHHTSYEFVLEVQPPNGQAFRAKTTHSFPSFTPHPEVGDMVYVKYDPKSLKVELHVHGDNRYGWSGEKHHEQAQRQAEQAKRDALLAAPPGTPVSGVKASGGAGMAGLDPELQELMRLEEAERRAAQANPSGLPGMNNVDQEMLELMQEEEAERRAGQAGGQQGPGFQQIQAGQVVQMSPGGYPGAASSINPQAAMAFAEAQALRQQLEYTGASGKAQILRKQQAGSPIDRFVPFYVEVTVHPDHHGHPFQCSFTAWIDTSKGTLMEGYTIPVKYDPQNTARIVFVLPT